MYIAWKAIVLPLNYARVTECQLGRLMPYHLATPAEAFRNAVSLILPYPVVQCKSFTVWNGITRIFFDVLVKELVVVSPLYPDFPGVAKDG